MNDDSEIFVQDTILIPLTADTYLNNEGEENDPRLAQATCLKIHELKKKFLTQLNSTPHKLVASDHEKNTPISTVHSNAHNYELINNPRDTPFFSLHGPKYEDVVKYFDPRRTQLDDILGQTIYQQQAFLDPVDEIPATNDILFENLIPDFPIPQDLDLDPLDIDDIIKEDGEVTQTPTALRIPETPPKCSPSPKSNNIGFNEQINDYKNLVLDVLTVKSSDDIKKTLMKTNLLKKAINRCISNEGSSSPSMSSDQKNIINTYLEEKSVVGDRTLLGTPKLPVKKKTLLCKLASDPNDSFIHEFDRSLTPSSTSTPKGKTNLSKRKKVDQPRTTSPSNSNKLSPKLPVKRLKTSDSERQPSKLSSPRVKKSCKQNGSPDSSPVVSKQLAHNTAGKVSPEVDAHDVSVATSPSTSINQSHSAISTAVSLQSSTTGTSKASGVIETGPGNGIVSGTVNASLTSRTSETPLNDTESSPSTPLSDSKTTNDTIASKTTIDPSALEKESLTSDIKAKKSTKKRKPKQPFQYGTISSSATRYTESVLVISDSYASLTLDTGNLGTPGIQVTNLPLTTIKEACVVVSDFAASSSLASSMVTKIFIRLGTHELLKGYVLDLLLKDVSDLLKLLKRLYKEASIFVCSLLPVEDKMYSSQTRENVTVFNSWLYSSCDPSMKIYYLNFYALFISSYGKNFGMFKDNVYLNHWGEVMLLSYFQRVVQNKIDLV